MNSSGPGRYGDNKSGAGVDDLFLLHLEGRLKTDFLFSAIIVLKINISSKNILSVDLLYEIQYSPFMQNLEEPYKLLT